MSADNTQSASCTDENRFSTNGKVGGGAASRVESTDGDYAGMTNTN